jgi:uncharacterized protein YbdZ (MbtH family)
MYLNRFYLLLLICVLSACTEKSSKELSAVQISAEQKTHQEIYDLGFLVKNKYKHALFRVEIECPEGWDRWSREREKKFLYDSVMAQEGNKRLAEIMSSDLPGSYTLLTLFKNENAEITRGSSVVFSVVDAAILNDKGIKSFTEWVDQGHKYNEFNSMTVIAKGKKGNDYQCLRQRLVSWLPDGRKFIQDSYKYDLGDYWVNIVVSCPEEDIEKYEHFGLSLKEYIVSK